MSTPETKVKDKTKKMLKVASELLKFGYKIHYNAGTGYGAASIDAEGVINGLPIAIEFKRFDGDGDLTARQIQNLREYRAAGAWTWVIDSEAQLELFRSWVYEVAAKNRGNDVGLKSHYGCFNG